MSSVFRCKSLFRDLFWIGLMYIFGCGMFVQNFAWAVVRTIGITEPVYITREVLVQYRPGASFTEIVNTYNNLGLNEVAFSPFSGFRRVRVPANLSVYTVAATLSQNPTVAYAEPNYLRAVHFTPNDPLYGYQWHLNNPMMEMTWDLSIGSNVIVAVLDTGVAYRTGGGYAQAPDLAGTSFIPGYDFINDDDYPDDDNRHGTHITGTIAQTTNNLYGVAGVAPGCIIMPVKVLDETGYGDVAAIADGIYYAVNNGAQVINMSLGGTRSGKGPRNKSAAEEEAINYAVSQGVTVVCSAGNESTDLPSYPASYDATISVTATTYDQTFAETYSNFGPDIDICAPGGDLDEDLNNDEEPDGIYQQTHDGSNYKSFDFYFAEGTSSAAAFVTGVVALVLGYAGQPLTPAEIREILHSTAIDLGDPGWDPYYGWGLVNPLAAVQAALPLTAEGLFLPFPIGWPSNSRSNVFRTPLPVSVDLTNNIYFGANANFLTSGQAIIGNNQQFLASGLISSHGQNPLLAGIGGQINPSVRNFLSYTSNPSRVLDFSQALFPLSGLSLVNSSGVGQYQSETAASIISASAWPFQIPIKINPFLATLNPFVFSSIPPYSIY